MSILSNYENDRKQAVGLAGNVSAMAKQRESIGKQLKQQAKERKKTGMLTTAGTAAGMLATYGSLAAIPGAGWAALGVMALSSLF